MDDSRMRISTFQELREREPEVLERVCALPNGERLFLTHPLRALADAGIDLGDDALARISRLHPNLAVMPETAYDALRASPIAQSGTIHLSGLFDWGKG
jgi:hypothetical protein